MAQRSWDSTALAVAVARARLCGCTVVILPVRSTMPSSRPLSGSCTGAAAQVQLCTISLKCSAAKTCTAWSAARAVPIALVPAPFSLHRAPSVKFIESAAAMRTFALPPIHSRSPSASLTTIRWADSSAMAVRLSSIKGRAAPSGCTSRRDEVSSSSARTGARCSPEGSTPASCERRHESAIGARIAPSFPSPTNRSHSPFSSRARLRGDVAASIASHGLAGTALSSLVGAEQSSVTRSVTLMKRARE